jgi:hypothetical protein
MGQPGRCTTGARRRATRTARHGPVDRPGVYTALPTVRYSVSSPYLSRTERNTVHKHTLNASYLATARHMGQYFLDHVPSDGIVPWDFQAPLIQNGVPRPADSSAAMIAANGMLLLAHQEEVIGNASGRAWWSAQAMNVSDLTLREERC